MSGPFVPVVESDRVHGKALAAEIDRQLCGPGEVLPALTHDESTLVQAMARYRLHLEGGRR